MRRAARPGLLAAVAAGVFALGAGCASENHVALPAVGPSGAAEAAGSTAAPGDAPTGVLVVYSEAIPVAKHRSPPEYAHTGYVVRKASYEKVVAQVDNRVAEADERPDMLPLPPGLYQVDARCAGIGRVLVPVLIEAGKRTEVYLDSEGMPKGRASALVDPVTLANGRIVGARAVAAAAPERSP